MVWTGPTPVATLSAVARLDGGLQRTIRQTAPAVLVRVPQGLQKVVSDPFSINLSPGEDPGRLPGWPAFCVWHAS